MWFIWETKARQKGAGLRVQQTHRTFLHTRVLGTGSGRTRANPLPAEIRR